jgi:hypothetical protein
MIVCIETRLQCTLALTLALEEWPHDTLGHSQLYNQGSIDFDEGSKDRERGRRYGVTLTDGGAEVSLDEDLWLGPQSTTFSNVGLAPTASDVQTRME